MRRGADAGLRSASTGPISRLECLPRGFRPTRPVNNPAGETGQLNRLDPDLRNNFPYEGVWPYT